MNKARTDTVLETEVCLLGRGTSLFWLNEWLARHFEGADSTQLSKSSLLWLCPTKLPAAMALREEMDELAVVGRHAWPWWVRPEFQSSFAAVFGVENPVVQLIDVKSAKRLKFGDHEIKAFEKILGSERADLRPLHESLKTSAQTRQVELLQPILWIDEFVVQDGVLTAVKVCLPEGKFVTIHAKTFIVGELEEPLGQILKDEGFLAGASSFTKGKFFQSGYSLRFQHRADFADLVQNREEHTHQLIPLVANPSKKGAGSHLFGVYSQTESVWFGFLTEEELEDNNEVLKKIKSSKRILERTIPGFEESLVKNEETEFLTFEPHMMALDPLKTTHLNYANLHFLTDLYGPEAAFFCVAHVLQKVFPQALASQVDLKLLKQLIHAPHSVAGGQNVVLSKNVKESDHQL